VNRVLLRSPAFARSIRRYVKRHPDQADTIRLALEQLADDAYHPSLRTHKLKGDLAGSWACSAGYDLRIVFDFVSHEGAEAILLLTIGSHDEVY
jgi:mRNA-degrading endonuclease YafQ of YafQ-DinJ toxin-antitoxin module